MNIDINKIKSHIESLSKEQIKDMVEKATLDSSEEKGEYNMEKKTFLIRGTIDNGASFESVRMIVRSDNSDTAKECAKKFVDDTLHGDEFFTISSIVEIETVIDGVVYYRRGTV